MRKMILFIILSSLIACGQVLGEESGQLTKEKPEISKEDMEIIKNMEILELMEIARELQLLQEMNILIEEDEYEKNN